MKLGVLNVPLGGMPFNEACAYLKSIGVEAIEIGCGGYPGKAHCDPEILLNDEGKYNEFIKALADSGLEVAALSTHGNPVHPNKETAENYHKDFVNAVLLAEKMGVKTVVTFSGCPGDAPKAKYPNWVTCPWPEDFLAVLDYQWKKVLIPYWKKTAKFAKEHGIEKIALEMHPGFCVYNPETLLRLRAEVGDIICANFDPSHLFWQGIDPVAGIRALKGAIGHFHAKDTKVNPYNTAKFGVLDTKHYSDEENRSWIFRAVGCGHDRQVWNDIMAQLVLSGYNGAICIEHEDSLMSSTEGLEKAVAFLKDVIIKEAKPTEMFWA